MIEVTYQLEREDYWQYNTFVIGRIPALKRQIVFSLLFFPAVITFDLWIFHVGRGLGWLILLGAAACVVWGAFFLWSRKRAYSPRFGFIIPKRAFPTPEQARLFLETAQAYRQSVINGTTPVLPSIPQSWPPAPSRITQGKL